jgi:AcrR family transcriptional regulator
MSDGNRTHLAGLVEFEEGATMAKKEYRSAVRSREAIRRAFVELLEEVPLEKVTVTEIVKRADVNRSTFYAHYPDVYGVLEEIEEETLDEVRSALSLLEGGGFLSDPTPALRQVARVIEANKESYRVLIKADGFARFFVKLQETYSEYMLESEKIPERLRANPEYRMRVFYFAGGFTNLMRMWLLGKTEMKIDDIAVEVGKMVSLASADLRRELGIG